MNCPACGARTLVMSSRSPDSAKKHHSGPMFNAASSAVTWYTSDWVARRRHCPKCTKNLYTVELVIEDLIAMRESK